MKTGEDADDLSKLVDERNEVKEGNGGAKERRYLIGKGEGREFRWKTQRDKETQ